MLTKRLNLPVSILENSGEIKKRSTLLKQLITEKKNESLVKNQKNLRNKKLNF